MATIRRVTPDDWQMLKATRLEALTDAPHAFGSTRAEEVQLDEMEWRRRAGTMAWFIALQDYQPVGIVAGGRFSDHPARDLIAMWTRENARGSGVAAELVGAVINWGREEQASELLLWVAYGNDRARRFYERLGFESTGNRKQLRSNPEIGEDELRFSL